jgi:hypothetical protein
VLNGLERHTWLAAITLSCLLLMLAVMPARVLGQDQDQVGGELPLGARITAELRSIIVEHREAILEYRLRVENIADRRMELIRGYLEERRRGRRGVCEADRRAWGAVQGGERENEAENRCVQITGLCSWEGSHNSVAGRNNQPYRVLKPYLDTTCLIIKSSIIFLTPLLRSIERVGAEQPSCLASSLSEILWG